MTQVTPSDLAEAITAVIADIDGISELYPSQRELIATLFQHDNIFYTASTNSGKTLPTVLYPSILKQLAYNGYNFPQNPKLLFVTALNSLQLSLKNNVKALGIDCEAVTSANLGELIASTTSVLFISPEVLKLPSVTQTLLSNRSSFVLKVVDECHLGRFIKLLVLFFVSQKGFGSFTFICFSCGLGDQERSQACLQTCHGPLYRGTQWTGWEATDDDCNCDKEDDEGFTRSVPRG